jgi:GT2 family glycosyltransferase
MYVTGLDVVVVNYRTADDLSAFYQSLIAFPPQREWTLTVVNVSPQVDDVIAGDRMADEIGAAHLVFDDNVGYGRACNAGALKGEHQHLVLFNADVTLRAGALESCCQALETHPDWGVLGPRQVDLGARLTHAGIFGTEARPQHRAWLRPDNQLYADIVPAVTVSGAAYFIPRPVWDQLTDCAQFAEVAPAAEGAFLPTSHYWNETYTSYHARAHGWQVVYYGPVCIVHKWHRASAVGGPVDTNSAVDRAYFRRACEAHGMDHD